MVWNLVTASVWWSAAVAASCLAVDPVHGAFVIAVPPEPVRRWTGSAAPPALPAGPSAARPMMNGFSEAAAQQPRAAPPANGVQMNGRRNAAAAAGWPHMNGAAANGRAGAQSGSDEDTGQEAGQRTEDAISRLQESSACAGGAFWYDEAEGTGDERAVAHASGGVAAKPTSSRGSLVYGGGGGSVLLFDAGCPTPKQAWLLPRSAVICAYSYRLSCRKAL